MTQQIAEYEIHMPISEFLYTSNLREQVCLQQHSKKKVSRSKIN